MRKSANTKSALKQRMKKSKEFGDAAIKASKKYQSMSKSKHAPTRKEGKAQLLRHLGVQKRKSKRK
jgi:hypothetical protein